MIQKIKLTATILVLVHAAVVALHGVAHGILEVNGSWLDDAFIVLVIMLSPIVAGTLVWTRRRRTGVLILGLSMLGALVYGTYNHFIASGIDNLCEVSIFGWGAVFRMTAILLAITEGVGCAVAIWAFSMLAHEKVAV